MWLVAHSAARWFGTDVALKKAAGLIMLGSYLPALAHRSNSLLEWGRCVSPSFRYLDINTMHHIIQHGPPGQ